MARRTFASESIHRTQDGRAAPSADRKAAGESSIHKGADGRWHGFVSMGLKEGGKRDRRHVAAVKRADVVRRVRELEEQRDAGIVLANGRGPTVQEWMTLRLNSTASRKVHPSTLAGYRTCVNRSNLHLGHHRLDKLQSEHLEAFYTRLEAKGLSSTTAGLLHHRVISRASSRPCSADEWLATLPHRSTPPRLDTRRYSR